MGDQNGTICVAPEKKNQTSWATLESNSLLSWMGDYPWNGGLPALGCWVTILEMVGKVLIL